MNRRSILKFLAGLPLLGLFLPKKASAASTPGPFVRPKAPYNPLGVQEEVYLPFFPQTLMGPMEPEKMADLLIANLRAERQRQSEAQIKWALENGELIVSEPVREMMEEKICRSMCKHLNDWSLSAPYDRDFEKDPTVALGPKHPVRFDVMTAPVNYAHIRTHIINREKVQQAVIINREGAQQAVHMEVLKAESRKVRLSWSLLNEAKEDLHSCNNPITEEEIIDTVGQTTALEIQMEIRHAERAWVHPDTGVLNEGNPVLVYALYIPPHMTPSYFDPKNFSVNRALRMRYAKMYKHPK